MEQKEPTKPNTHVSEWVEKLRPQPEALAFVPRDLALEASVLPLYFENGTLVVAVAEPVNIPKLSAMQFTLGRRLGMVRVPRAALSHAIRNTYGQVAVPEVNSLVDAVAAPQEIRRLPNVRQMFEPGTMRPRVIGVTSGKGGVGKTTLTANLGVALSMLGLRVGMIDCDFGLSNLHLSMGVKPEHTLADVVMGGRDAIGSMAPGFAGVKVLAGVDGITGESGWDYSTLRSAGAGFDIFRLHYDVTLVDTAAGVNDGVISTLEAVDQILLIVTPDPNSIHDAYVTTKTLLEHKPDAQIDVIVNQSVSDQDARLMFAKFQSTLSQSVGGQIKLKAIIPWDRAVVDAVRSRVPYVLAKEHTASSHSVMNLARNLTGLDSVAQQRRNLFQRVFAHS